MQFAASNQCVPCTKENWSYQNHPQVTHTLPRSLSSPTPARNHGLRRGASFSTSRVPPSRRRPCPGTRAVVALRTRRCRLLVKQPQRPFRSRRSRRVRSGRGGAAAFVPVEEELRRARRCGRSTTAPDPQSAVAHAKKASSEAASPKPVVDRPSPVRRRRVSRRDAVQFGHAQYSSDACGYQGVVAKAQEVWDQMVDTQVAWVENVKVDSRLVHNIYKLWVNLGFSFAAHWLEWNDGSPVRAPCKCCHGQQHFD